MRILTIAFFALGAGTASCHFTYCSTAKPTYMQPPAGSYTATIMKVEDGGADDAVSAARVSPEFFKEAGAPPMLGRVFVPPDYNTASSTVVVISYEYWQNRFSGDPGTIGRRIQLDSQPAIVIGVMPRGFDFPQNAKLWLPDVDR
jgi:hypothetical protein